MRQHMQTLPRAHWAHMKTQKNKWDWTKTLLTYTGTICNVGLTSLRKDCQILVKVLLCVSVGIRAVNNPGLSVWVFTGAYMKRDGSHRRRLFSLWWVCSYTMHREVCKCDRWCVRAAAQDIIPVVRMADTLNSSVIKAIRPHGQVRITRGPLLVHVCARVRMRYLARPCW